MWSLGTRLSLVSRGLTAPTRDMTVAPEVRERQTLRDGGSPLYQHCYKSLNPHTFIFAFTTVVRSGHNYPPCMDAETKTKGSHRDMIKVSQLLRGCAKICLRPLDAKAVNSGVRQEPSSKQGHR